ncbi:MAG: hypothetical protein ACTHMW_09885 [Actinomycetes bacterium]
MTTAPASPAATSPSVVEALRTSHRRILLAAMLPAAVTAVLVVALGALRAGTAGAVGGAVGSVLVFLFFGAGLWVMRATAGLSPQVAMLAALASYAGKVILLAIALGLLKDVDALDRTVFALGAFAVGTVWLLGEVLGFARARVPLVDAGTGTVAAPGAGSGTGSGTATGTAAQGSAGARA